MNQQLCNAIKGPLEHEWTIFEKSNKTPGKILLILHIPKKDHHWLPFDQFVTSSRMNRKKKKKKGDLYRTVQLFGISRYFSWWAYALQAVVEEEEDNIATLHPKTTEYIFQTCVTMDNSQIFSVYCWNSTRNKSLNEKHIWRKLISDLNSNSVG